MIKFFRKIRQNLLSEGKTGKYFKYAIGEIILVVIGILIALQINNWNENRKAENEEEQLLESLKMEMEENLILIDEYLVIANYLEKDYNTLLNYANTNYSFKKEDSLVYILSRTFNLLAFTPKNALLNAAESSNSIRLIKDKSIKTGLSEWKLSLQKQIALDVTSNEHYYGLMPIISSHFPLQNVTYYLSSGKNGAKSSHKIELEKLFRSLEFENSLYRMGRLSKVRISTAKDLKTETLNLIEYLNNELNKK
ncbi:MAG: DUF6090 family protein [Bacteroidia bacterium]|nr:DUF6090 family protein [Bacteroidia bacterium]